MSRYAEAHVSPKGPGDARPTALQIIRDEGLENKLRDKVIVITGVSSGIGIETVRALAATGATLILTARDVSKAESALADMLDASRMRIVQMDNASLASVRSAAAAILEETSKVNVLINNAGVMFIQTRELTEDGYEMQFATNHLAHFLLFNLLKPALLAASTPEFPSRVVNVSSGGHRVAGINETGNYNHEAGGYDPALSYGQSKTANIYMANEIDRRYGGKGIHATSLHPGIINTPLARHMPQAQIDAIVSAEGFRTVMKSPEQGAATTVWAAVGAEWAHRGGRFLSGCAETVEGERSDLFNEGIHAPHAYDPEKEARLWRDSLKMVGLKDDQ
ncbi:putative short-chain dehydrogenase [Colletotrichum musicola]|uniref:Putative short-chain dehydrogenase n=1 Tax=Colletotrichum musicola TaxID=2175873 RepID=A0A8H6MQ71_9PEZI|nr:putative short-chain dehydrogenase [Colletotrichum musicola]